MLSYYSLAPQAFSALYLQELRGQILANPLFTTNNLNRDFLKTKGFSVVFQRSHLSQVQQKFPYFKPYLEKVLQSDCNAFYLNPLWLEKGSQVDPHIDRSLRGYCESIDPPVVVSVLYVHIPSDMQGGDLILSWKKRVVGQIRPQQNTLLFFQGNLTHAILPVTQGIGRLSLVCEQYELPEKQLLKIPSFRLESRGLGVRY